MSDTAVSKYPPVHGDCNGRQCGNLKAIESLATRLAAANAEIERLRHGLNSGAKEIDRILLLGREEACEWRDLALGFADVRGGLVALAVTGEAAKESK